MTSTVVSMGSGTDVASLTVALLKAGQRAVPIVDDSRLVGIVTRRDLVRVVGRDGDAIAREVRHKLEIYGGTNRWDVAVHRGVVTISDQFDDAADRHIATVLAESVPGVTRAQTISAQA